MYRESKGADRPAWGIMNRSDAHARQLVAKPSGYDAAMRGVRPTLILVIVALVLLGRCAPGLTPTPDLPASFTSMLRTQGLTFTTQAPPLGAVAATEAVRRVRDHVQPRLPFAQGRALPIFGLINCVGDPGQCAALDMPPPGGSAGFYLVVYPDWAGPGGDIGWAIVPAVSTWDGRWPFFHNDPRPRP